MKTRLLLLSFFLILLGCKNNKSSNDSEESGSSASSSSTESVGSNSGSQMKITNAVDCFLTMPGGIIIIDENDNSGYVDIGSYVGSYYSAREKVDSQQFDKLLVDVNLEEEKNEAGDDEETDLEEQELVEEIPEEEVITFHNNDGSYVLSRNATTIILDTERDASGKAVQRHIYFYDGKQNALASNGSHIQGDNKISRVSLPASDDNIDDWRRELQNVIAPKNESLLREIKVLKDKFNQGRISDSEYNEELYLLKRRLYESRESPFFFLKVMDNVECGDVIDALTMLNKCEIPMYCLDYVNHTDSVMVFNSLFPSEDMSPGVDFYSHGAFGGDQNLAAFPWCDLKRDFLNGLDFDPLLSINVSSRYRDGIWADFTMMMNDGVMRNFLHDNDVSKENIDRLFSSDSFKKCIEFCGIDKTNPHKFELGPTDYLSMATNDFRNSLVYTKRLFGKLGLKDRQIIGDRSVLVYTYRHTLFGALKYVLDDLCYERIYRVTLAY